MGTRERASRKDHLSAGSFPKRPEGLELGQAESRSLGLHLHLPHGWPGPKDFGLCSTAFPGADRFFKIGTHGKDI